MAVTDATMDKPDSRGNPLRDRIRAEIDKLYREGIGYGEDGFSMSLYPTSVTPGRGKFVGDLVRQLKPASTLEIGMCWGLSTLHILEAMVENGGVRQPASIAKRIERATSSVKCPAEITLRAGRMRDRVALQQFDRRSAILPGCCSLTKKLGRTL